VSAWIDKYRINPYTPLQLRIDFCKDVAGSGVTDYNIGGKKLINMFCGECQNVMCCASIIDGGRKIIVTSCHIELYYHRCVI
jgi:hypothetical protein